MAGATPDPGAAEEVRSYYGRPVIKPPVWTVEVPWYFFAGGLAGASSSLAVAARLAGRHRLARRANRAALVGALASPALLISDLGRPDRFHHMLRVIKPTSPMSLGTWLLTLFAPAAGAATVLQEVDMWPRLQRLAEAIAGSLGPAVATYTAVLVADTAVPVWHEARQQLPFVFAGGAAASAGAAAVLLTPPGDAGPARRLTVAGALLEAGATHAMQRRLGDLADPYRQGEAGRYARAAKALTGAGAGLLAVAGRRRIPAVAGAGLALAGAACQRFAVFKAGLASARDPAHTVAPQRRRLLQRRGQLAARSSVREPDGAGHSRG